MPPHPTKRPSDPANRRHLRPLISNSSRSALLIGPSRQLALGIVTGVVVVATFLLLISERSKEWSMGLDLTEERPGDPGKDDPSG